MNATFYDPHPGLAGCDIPIPEEVRRVANELNGKTLDVAEAMALIRNAAAEALPDTPFEIVNAGDYIGLRTRGDYPRQSWRVIRYREASLKVFNP